MGNDVLKGSGINYLVASAKQAAAKYSSHLAAIHKNNMKDKKGEKDVWYTKLHLSYERVFAHHGKRVHYQVL